MLMTLFIQDLPFCAARCYFIFNLGIRSQMMIFFTLKNLLVVMLQLYRLKVLWVNFKNKKFYSFFVANEAGIFHRKSLGKYRKSASKKCKLLTIL